MTQPGAAAPAGAPREGQRTQLDVEGLDPNGDGVARTADNFVVFVEGGLPGDRVEAEITHRARRFARARLSRLVRPSPHRVAVPCAVAEECGGCPLMGLAYPAQLDARRKLVVDALERIGGVRGAAGLVRPVRGMARPWEYRNKAQYPVARDASGRLAIGFYRRRSHEVVPALDCRVQHPTNVRLAAAARDALEELGLAPYDESTGRGLVRHVTARVSRATGEGLLVVVTAGEPLPAPGVLDELARRVKARVPELVGVVQNINPRRTNVILGRENRLVWGRDWIEERVGHLRLRLYATAFFQVNTEQAGVLYGEVRERIRAYQEERGRTLPSGRLLDLYCGVGGIGLSAADLVGEVVGVEEVKDAVADAQANASLNGIPNARFVAGLVEEVLPQEAAAAAASGEPLMVVVDPPRKGLDVRVVETLAKTPPDLFVYVSCSPATMARDLRQFMEKAAAQGARYRWGPVQPVDMFPHTAHVEAVTHLIRVKG